MPILDEFLAELDAVQACKHPRIQRSLSPKHAEENFKRIQECPELFRRAHLRSLARGDLFFLLVYVLNQSWMVRNERAAKWYFDRCKEVQDRPTGVMRFWSRGSGKTTIATFGRTIQEILIDPNVTIGIFSHNRPIAKGFLRQIKTELESNKTLLWLFPEILHRTPQRQAIKWSENEGLIVKRSQNRQECTVEAWGLVDAMPTGKHFDILVYDDVIDERFVTTPDMIAKVTEKWELSQHLGATKPPAWRLQGVFFAAGDTYQTLIERGVAQVEIRPAVTTEGSLLWTEEEIQAMRSSMSEKTWATQILLDLTKIDSISGFRPEWLTYYKTAPARASLNVYIFVDPAGAGNESDSFTAMAVVGLSPDKRVYILDLVVDRLTLSERADHLLRLVQKYNPLVVFYETFAMQADIEYIKEKMDQLNFRFRLEPVKAHRNSAGRTLSKEERIAALEPMFREGLILLPEQGIKKTMFPGKEVDLVQFFVDREYLPYPHTKHKDILDCLSQLRHPDVLRILTFPYSYRDAVDPNNSWRRVMTESLLEYGSWMSQ